MTSTEIRTQFLRYFEERSHRIVPSAPVVPYDDPTLLFTNAGMNQFKDVFLGSGKRDYTRAADAQKCIRVSGKHNDLEEVGRDTYHHTFFEMLGNWSFGDYYKKEAIAWAWDLLTNVWGLEKRRLYATVFETDDEAEQLWKSATDIAADHVLRFGKKDNFWEMGETGPCGPCSEIHIDLTPDYSGGGLVNAGDPRVMEIWNLVFIQYDRDANGTLTPLPAKHVDTGMGFERLCAVLQRKSSNYDTDVFLPIIARISQLAAIPYTARLDRETDVAMRVIADHVRMLSFSIADGAMPSNEGRGYVMRRILRRAARFGRTLGVKEPFIHQVVDAVASSMGTQYPEVRERRAHIERVIRAEEESFNATLDRGLEIFAAVVDEIGHARTFPGEDAFKLYDTYGFPLDLTELMASERGLKVDVGTFTELMEEQRSRSRGTESAGSGDAADTHSARIRASREGAKRLNAEKEEALFSFAGYDSLETDAVVLRSEGELLILDRTPFYGESGGQVGDQGDLVTDRGMLRVVDTQRNGSVCVHILETPERLELRSKVTARVAADRRRNIMANHTATHIVHEALRRVLGTHLRQAGSLVAPDHLRFDFNHFERITPEQLRTIEEIVNEKIVAAIEVHAINDPRSWLTIDEAKAKYPNVKMFFGDKYGDRVRIVEIDPQFSVELCGGTHVGNTRELGLFKIISESSVASGVRRIEAVTGEGLDRYLRQRIARTGELDRTIERLLAEREDLQRQLGTSIPPPPGLRLPPAEIPGPPFSQGSVQALEELVAGRERALEELTKHSLDLRKELSRHRVKEAAGEIEEIVAKGVAADGFTVAAARVEVGDAEELKSLADTLRSKIASGVGVLGAVVDGKVALVCVVTDDLIREKRLRAGTIVSELAKRVGGGGGGRPHLATAGGKDTGRLDETLKETASIVKSMLSQK